MFTGIIETVGKIVGLHNKNGNLILEIQSTISGKLKPGQSVSHDGICLTVVSRLKNTHKVIAVEETLRCTTLRSKQIGDHLNLERAMRATDRFEGHIVQGHVDTTGRIKKIEHNKGSRIFTIVHNAKIIRPVHKGSVCINGVSLTISKAAKSEFAIAIIPYTFDHTTFRDLRVGDDINLEWDVLAKYLVALSKKH